MGKIKLDYRGQCLYLDLPNGWTVYLDWSIPSDGIIFDKWITTSAKELSDE